MTTTVSESTYTGFLVSASLLFFLSLHPRILLLETLALSSLHPKHHMGSAHNLRKGMNQDRPLLRRAQLPRARAAGECARAPHASARPRYGISISLPCGRKYLSLLLRALAGLSSQPLLALTLGTLCLLPAPLLCTHHKEKHTTRNQYVRFCHIRDIAAPPPRPQPCARGRCGPARHAAPPPACVAPEPTEYNTCKLEKDNSI